MQKNNSGNENKKKKKLQKKVGNTISRNTFPVFFLSGYGYKSYSSFDHHVLSGPSYFVKPTNKTNQINIDNIPIETKITCDLCVRSQNVHIEYIITQQTTTYKDDHAVRILLFLLLSLAIFKSVYTLLSLYLKVLYTIANLFAETSCMSVLLPVLEHP